LVHAARQIPVPFGVAAWHWYAKPGDATV